MVSNPKSDTRLTDRLRSFAQPARLRVLIAILAVLVMVFGILWYRNRVRNERLESVAAKVLSAFASGDSSTIWHYMNSEEKRLVGINESGLDRFLDWARGRAGALTLDGQPVFDVMGNGFSLTATQVFRTPDKRPVMFTITVYRTEEGPCAFVSAGMFFVAMESRYGMDFVGNPRAAWLAVDKGLETEEQGLVSIGLKGIADIGSEPKLFTWKGLKTFASKVAGRDKSTESPHR